MTTPHTIHFLDIADVSTVLARLPSALLVRLGQIDLVKARATRTLGFVLDRSRADLWLCSRLPPRLSLRSYMNRGDKAIDYGAPEQGQWPPWAVRRYLLYNILLHEIGHLQVVRDSARSTRRFAHERLADTFANDIRGALYSESFSHVDPIHNVPTPEELALVPWWNRLDKDERLRVVEWVLDAPDASEPVASDEQRAFLRKARIAGRPHRRWMDRAKQSQRTPDNGLVLDPDIELALR